MSNTIILRVEPAKQILKLTKDAKKLLLKPEAEEAIVKLLEYEEKVKEAIDLVKEAIAEGGEKMLPGFKGVQSGRVRVMNRVYGSKFKFSGGVPADEGFIKTKEITSIDTKAVEAYVKTTKEFPTGIEANERKPQISITLVKEK